MVKYWSYNKFGNQKTEYNGFMYDSKHEADYAYQLDMRLYAKDIKSWTKQYPIQVTVNGKKICKYYCDFVITNLDGSLEYIDCKSSYTAKNQVYKLKKALVEATHCIKIIEVYN